MKFRIRHCTHQENAEDVGNIGKFCGINVRLEIGDRKNKNVPFGLQLNYRSFVGFMVSRSSKLRRSCQVSKVFWEMTGNLQSLVVDICACRWGGGKTFYN